MVESHVTLPESTDGVPLAYKYDNVKLFIVEGEEPDFEKFEIGVFVRFVPEPNNPFDKRAIYAIAKNTKLGYLYKGKIQDMVHDFCSQECPVIARIETVSHTEKEIYLCMGFYRSPLISNDDGKSFKLTGNKNQNMQDNILLSVIGQEVGIDYDYEKDKYVVTDSGGEIGYLPRKVEKYLEDKYSAVIENIETNESENYDVTIRITAK